MFTNMLWRYRHRYTSYAVHTFSSPAWARARRRIRAAAPRGWCGWTFTRTQDATGSVHKELRTARSIIAL